ncbi:testican-1-like [Hippoglossus hippoglossus]|uniref:testican-1-like n=1 Tax=Hippoglossus hippoglossus TaxID=8267 RepID=UPI00148B735A|nr:testican-1-like [Hippoglossus hippoglossus]
MNFDLLLDQAEMSAIDLDKYELCMKPLFQLLSCNSFKDGKLSYNEWCYCFQQPGGLTCQSKKKYDPDAVEGCPQMRSRRLQGTESLKRMNEFKL